MTRTSLILGGARSGKTRRALALAPPFQQKIFIATAEARDAEMRDRIARHKADRGADWQTIEEPLDLAGALRSADGPERVIVIDCLTLWLANLMEQGGAAEVETVRLAALIPTTQANLVFVSNELGLGLVPETDVGRAFRDAQGRLNQSIAAVVDTAELIVAGLPLKLKG